MWHACEVCGDEWPCDSVGPCYVADMVGAIYGALLCEDCQIIACLIHSMFGLQHMQHAIEVRRKRYLNVVPIRN
jgi:hypothetical protein